MIIKCFPLSWSGLIKPAIKTRAYSYTKPTQSFKSVIYIIGNVKNVKNEASKCATERSMHPCSHVASGNSFFSGDLIGQHGFRVRLILLPVFSFSV